jgi:hypothetical protein
VRGRLQGGWPSTGQKREHLHDKLLARGQGFGTIVALWEKPCAVLFRVAWIWGEDGTSGELIFSILMWPFIFESPISGHTL